MGLGWEFHMLIEEFGISCPRAQRSKASVGKLSPPQLAVGQHWTHLANLHFGEGLMLCYENVP